jgi:hypothetical protein
MSAAVPGRAGIEITRSDQGRVFWAALEVGEKQGVKTWHIVKGEPVTGEYRISTTRCGNLRTWHIPKHWS